MVKTKVRIKETKSELDSRLRQLIAQLNKIRDDVEQIERLARASLEAFNVHDSRTTRRRLRLLADHCDRLLSK